MITAIAMGSLRVHDGGLILSGQGRAEISLGTEYTNNGMFTLSFWILKATADVWLSAADNHVDQREVWTGIGDIGLDCILSIPNPLLALAESSFFRL